MRRTMPFSLKSVSINWTYVTKALFIKKPPFGTRIVERQRLTWEESVERDLAKLNVRYWTRLACDRMKWGAVLDQTLSNNWM